VVRGRARFKAEGDDREVSAGSVIFVAAEVEHHFHAIEEELALLVFLRARRKLICRALFDSVLGTRYSHYFAGTQ
jgi:hypothetical protein